MFQDHASAARPSGTWHLPRLGQLLGWLLALDARYRERAHLERLDDRLLRDIGITRADVDAEFERPAPQPAQF